MARIVLDGVSKRYPDGTEAVSRTDLAIEDGEFFILVGPSGCGKSTLLKLIVGLEEPTTGEIRVDGTSLAGVDPKDRNMAMVFQSYALYPHMTVRQNMAFPLKLAKVDEAEIRSRVQQTAEILEVEGLLERRPAALSGGQRQRVAMGRAIVRQPSAFLLDEPLSNLDAKLRVQMRAEIARLQKRLGTTTIYVTHDQTEAMTLGDHIAVLREGRVQQVGTPQELYRDPANLFVAGFIGSPAMNFLPARVEGDRVLLPMADLSLPSSLRGSVPEGMRECIAGIRPEHLHPAEAGAEDPGSLPSFQASVEVVEWLGAELYVHLSVPEGSDVRATDALKTRVRAMAPDLDLGSDSEGRLPLVARLDGATPVAEGDPIALALRPEDVRLFEADTGRRVGGSP